MLESAGLLQWWESLPSTIKILSEIVTGIGILFLFIKKVRVTLLKPVKRLYNKLPFMKRIAWLEEQMVYKNAALEALLDGQAIIKNELTSNGGSSLKDSVLNIERSVVKIRAGQRVIQNNLPYGILEFDEFGYLISANEAVIDWSGRSMEELLGKGYLNIFHSDDMDFVSKQFMAAIFDNRICDIYARIYRDGEKPKMRFIARPTVLNGKIIGYSATLKEA